MSIIEDLISSYLLYLVKKKNLAIKPQTSRHDISLKKKNHELELPARDSL